MQPKWFDAGAKDYGFPPLALISLEFLLLGFLELKRYQGFKKTGKVRQNVFSPNSTQAPGISLVHATEVVVSLNCSAFGHLESHKRLRGNLDSAGLPDAQMAAD